MDTRIVALCTVAALAGCSAAPVHRQVVTIDTACTQRALEVVAHNVDAIAAHHYAAASRDAERAAHISLACAPHERTAAERFSDRWRAANGLVVAAELAHQAAQPRRAERLLAQGYGLMHSLRPPVHMNELTTTLVSQTRIGAERDMRGQWAYW